MRSNNHRQSATSESFSAAPLLNEYKRSFVLKRILQTIFGGCLLKFDYKVPFYVYLSQIILYAAPFLFGSVGILVSDLVATFSDTYVSLVTAIVFCIYINVVKFILKIIVYKQHQSTVPVVHKRSKNNLLAEEDLLEFDEDENCIANCCTPDKLSYLVPNLLNKSTNKSNKTLNVVLYIVKVLLDTLVAGFIIFCGVYFLSVTYLYGIYGLGGNIVVFILSWLVICNALYTLLIREPFEIAVYNSSNDSKLFFSLIYLSRAFYVICFFIVEMVYNFQSGSIPLTVIFWIKLVFISLPVLWSFGTLPPIDVFFIHLVEQEYIHLFGGTATATLFRFGVQVTLAVAVSMVHFIPDDIAIVALLSVFGYLLSSIDIVHVFLSISAKLSKRRNNIVSVSNDDFARIASPTSTVTRITASSTSIVSIEEIKEIVYHLVMLSLTVACSMLVYNLFTSNLVSTASAFQVEIALLYSCMGLYVLVELCSSFQNVHILFGLIRNPFYPKNCLNENYDENFEHTVNFKKKAFQAIKYARLILLRVVSPLVMCAVVTIDCYHNKVYNDTRYGYMRTLFVLRAYRWIWQSTQVCLFEMSFMAHLLLFVILYNTTTDTTMQASLINSYLPACMAASFVYDRVAQCINKFYTFILITFTSYSLKSQRNKLAKSFIVLNFVLLLPYIVPIIILSSILSAPLLPLFTFPAYFIGFPRLKRFWPEQLGKSDSTSNPDAYFYRQLTPHLLKSFKQCVLSGSTGSSIQPDTYFLSRFQDRIIWIQVLEASSSYCVVNVKGLELQETSCHTREAQYIDESFEATFEAGSWVSPNKFDCLQSCDLLLLKTYSDAKNTLVGILDNPDSLKLICDFYPKILHFFIIKHLITNASRQPSIPTAKPLVDPIVLITQTENMKPKNRLSPIQHKSTELPDINQNRGVARKLDLKTNESLPDWSDNDSLFDDFYDESKKKEKKNMSKMKADVHQDTHRSDEFDTSVFDNVGMEGGKKNVHGSTIFKMENFSASNFNEEAASSSSVLGIPSKWMNAIKSVDIRATSDDGNLRKTIGSANWLSKILGLIEKKHSNNNNTLVNEYLNTLTSSHFNFLLKCSQCLGLNGQGLNSLSPQTIFKLYTGELPWSQINEKITKEVKDLHAILIKAFCYTVKLTIDNVTIVPCESDDDLFDMLKTYEAEWFIGFEREPEYTQSIQNGKPYIFTLFSDSQKNRMLNKKEKGTVNSRTLTMKNVVSPLARLNNEVVKSIWSSTNLELLYMTNDDDERYSIQAHQFILRNLTIQASDPPLGYPIYNSKPLHISTCF